MTLREAEEILKDWKADFTWHNHVNCKDEAKCNGVETRDCAVEALLEAQKVIERQRACEIIEKYGAVNYPGGFEPEQAKQEILSQES